MKCIRAWSIRNMNGKNRGKTYCEEYDSYINKRITKSINSYYWMKTFGWI